MRSRASNKINQPDQPLTSPLVSPSHPHNPMSDRRIIFLDIDGVLQRGSSQNRFTQDLPELQRELSERYEDPAYLEMSEYDLGATYYDWDTCAVANVVELCEQSGAVIVISSNWRNGKSLRSMQRLFALHELGAYVVGMTPESVPSDPYSAYYRSRAEEVAAWLAANEDVESFVIIDDQYEKTFMDAFPNNFVHCTNLFSGACFERALKVLGA